MTELNDPVNPGAAASTQPVGQPASNPKFRWYVVHTYSGFEEKAKSSLLERIKLKNAEKFFGDIFIPTNTTESVTKTGKKRQVTRTQFPGYMLVQMELDDNTIAIVKETPRISGFIGDQRRPRPLSDSEVLKLTSPAAAAEAQKNAGPEIIFEKGEGVKVIDGPFSNFDGIVDEVKPEKSRLRVLVSIFGRETPVELEYRQVEKLG